jgi:hypothetical protein
MIDLSVLPEGLYAQAGRLEMACSLCMSLSFPSSLVDLPI